MQKYIFLCIVILMVSFASQTDVEATEPAQVATAVEAAPHALDLADDVVRVPLRAAEVLYVPLGAGEIVLSPLPGPGVASGLQRVGKGVLAPFKAGVAALKLPFHALEKLSSVGGSSAARNDIRRARK